MVLSSQMIAMFLGLSFFFWEEYGKKRTLYPKCFWILPCHSTAPKFARSPSFYFWGEGTKTPSVTMSHAILPHVVWFRPTFYTFLPKDIWFLPVVGRIQNYIGSIPLILGSNHKIFGSNQTKLGRNHIIFGSNQTKLGSNHKIFGSNQTQFGSYGPTFGKILRRFGSNHYIFGYTSKHIWEDTTTIWEDSVETSE